MGRNSLRIVLAILVSFHNVTEASSFSVQKTYERFKKRVSGDGTYFGPYRGGGHCSLDPLPPIATQKGWIRVAAAPGTYQHSLGCGMCLKITGTGQGSGITPIKGTYKAVVVDQCGGCGEYGLDFFTRGDGIWKISYVAIDCPTIGGSRGKIQFRFQGSNPWYIKLQARNTKIPTAKMEVQVNGRYRGLQRVEDNFFVNGNLGKLSPPLRVRLTAVNGEQVTTTIAKIQNNKSFPSNVQFKGINRGR